MKKLLLLFVIVISVTSSQAQVSLNKAKELLKKKPQTTTTTEQQQPPPAPAPKDNAKDTATPASTPAQLKSYQNYDFVPGNKIIFEDNFMDDEDGEFPAHWKLISGQGVTNKADGQKFLVLTEGNYAKVMPRIKSATYLGSAFTVEFDYLVQDGGDYGAQVFFRPNNDEEDRSIHFGQSGEVSSNFPNNGFTASYPGSTDDFSGKWHHAAIVFKNNQVKCYLDQYRVLVIPDADFTPVSLSFGGIAEVRMTNIRIADGGGMNMLDKLTTDGKIVTHGITFDVNKATIKPESMGTLNLLVKLMTDKPDLKFEVGGHTDSDGEDAYNMKLSQQRADAVKAQLTKMGIDASRLTAKGYGESKPLNDNSSPENKANNRRVEFVKQ